MRTRSFRLPVLSVAAVAALSACTAEAPPTPGADPQGASPGPAGDAVESVKPVTDSAAMLKVEDQTSQGPTVLAKAAAAKGGFVVVFADEGRNVLGSGIVPAGSTPTDVQVSLADEVNEKTTLIARLYADTDGNGLFSAPDQPVSNGEDDDSDDVEVFPGEQETFEFTGKPVVNS